MEDLWAWGLREGEEGWKSDVVPKKCNVHSQTHQCTKAEAILCPWIHEHAWFFSLFLGTQYPELQTEHDSAVYFLMFYPVPIYVDGKSLT